jgi:hypothetical protein
MLLTALTFVLADCTSVEPASAATSVADVVASRTGYRPTDVLCPSGIDTNTGTKFECRFTGADGKPHIARLTITNLDGDHVQFDVELPEG